MSSGDAPPDYVTAVPYLRRFEPDLAPGQLRFVAALNGFAPPAGEHFDYCELGSAHGDTSAVHAAAYPSGRFVGIDLSAAHVASARETAAGGALANLHFVEGDFEALLSGGTATSESAAGPFDFVVAHGVWSWISPAKREALLAFASSRLKPGGLLYLGYNTLPGWAPVEPLRRWLVDRTRDFGGRSDDAESMLLAARKALDLAHAVHASKVGTLAANPAIGATLATIERAGLPYLVHEYLHEHWAPMYFADVARTLAGGGLYFVGQLPLFLNFRDLAVPATLAPLFEGMKERVAYESVLDYAVDQTFRRDVYVKGRGVGVGERVRAYFAETPWGRLDHAPAAKATRLPHRTLAFRGPVFDPLIAALDAGAKSLPELVAERGLGGVGIPRVRDALLHLAVGGQVSPFVARSASGARGVKSSARVAVQGAYNRWVLGRPLSDEIPAVLGSPVAGAGIPISTLQVVVLRALTEASPEARDSFLRSLLPRPFSIKVGDRAVDSGDPITRLSREVDLAASTWVPKLVELGVLDVQPESGSA